MNVRSLMRVISTADQTKTLLWKSMLPDLPHFAHKPLRILVASTSTLAAGTDATLSMKAAFCAWQDLLQKRNP